MTVGSLRSIVLDAPDITGLASFYAELTGWSIVETDDDWITIHTGDKQRVAFQLAPDNIAPVWPGQERPQQAHLDLFIDDHAAAADRAVALGATRRADGATWITLADPAGHPFDLCQKDGVGPTMELFAVTIDAPDALALARFYAELLGMDLTYEGAEGALIAGYDRIVMFQQIDNYMQPQWPNPAHPQQVHLDLTVGDLDEAEAQTITLGASPLPGRGEGNFRPFADPAGHPFCLCL